MRDKDNIEVEIKIEIDSIPVIVDKILKSGFVLTHKKYFETNIVFDTSDYILRKKNFLLRLRNQDKSSLLTLKKPISEYFIPAHYKEREEIELKVSNFENMKMILLSLGFQIFFIYEKYREVYGREESKIMVDQTPIGNFIEIEGEKGKIDNIAKQLGYKKEQFIIDSYYTLFKRKNKSGFMVFR